MRPVSTLLRRNVYDISFGASFSRNTKASSTLEKHQQPDRTTHHSTSKTFLSYRLLARIIFVPNVSELRLRRKEVPFASRAPFLFYLLSCISSGDKWNVMYIKDFAIVCCITSSMKSRDTLDCVEENIYENAFNWSLACYGNLVQFRIPNGNDGRDPDLWLNIVATTFWLLYKCLQIVQV